MNASEKMTASSIEVRGKNIKIDEIVKVQMIVVPIGHAGHVFTANLLCKV